MSATPDTIHEAAVEAATSLDRDYAARHPDAREYLRVALEHEMCPPGGPCWTMPFVRVAFLEPGSRMRFPWGADR